jgi:cob(I)alamin adenosyltransferase
MANLKLDPHYSLSSDSRQWILSKDDRSIKYFGSLDCALNSYLELKIRGSEAKTVIGLLEYHKRLLHALQQLLTPLQIKVDVSKAKEYQCGIEKDVLAVEK